VTSLLILPFYKQCIVDKIYTHHVSYETSKNAHSMFQKSLDPKMSHQTIVMGFFHQQIPYGTLRHAQSFLFEQVTIMHEVSILRHFFTVSMYFRKFRILQIHFFQRLKSKNFSFKGSK